VKRDGARRLRAIFAGSHPGGAGAPSGTTTSPCQELADDLGSYRPLTGKQGPALDERRNWRAERRPRVFGREPKGLRFSARHPLKARAPARRGKETACPSLAGRTPMG